MPKTTHLAYRINLAEANTLASEHEWTVSLTIIINQMWKKTDDTTFFWSCHWHHCITTHNKEALTAHFHKCLHRFNLTSLD